VLDLFKQPSDTFISFNPTSIEKALSLILHLSG